MQKKGLFYGFIALLLVFAIFLILLKINKPSDYRYCKSVGDCVPATCCHPGSLVNIKYAPDCGGVICTEVCEGPLDCGAGAIACINNKCEIIPKGSP